MVKLFNVLKNERKGNIERPFNKASTSTNENMKLFQENPHKRKGD